MVKKIWLAGAIAAMLSLAIFPEIAPTLYGMAVFLSIFGIAAGLELSERIYKLESEVESLKKQLASYGPQ